MNNKKQVVDLETLKRFDRQGPRYTSYPTAVEFHAGVREKEYRSELRRAVRDDAQAPLSLYIHLPFCRERCEFCACHAMATPHAEIATEYLEYVKREIDIAAGQLADRRSVVQLHLGGGTPTYYSADEIAGLFNHINDRFQIEQNAEVAIEVDPRVTNFEHLEVLAGLGFNRLSMGVQDFTDEVQQAIGRCQTYAETRDLLEHAREVGFDEGLNIDLVYGLPKQTADSFKEGLKRVTELRPDRLALYSFAFVPWIKANQRKLDQDTFPAPELKLRLYLTALSHLGEAGYEPIGMDHFALPHDELAVAAREGRLARNFMGYTVKPTSAMVAFGISAISDLQTGYFQNEKKLSAYYQAVDAGQLPVEKGYLLDADDQVRRYVITQLMCNFRVSKAVVCERFDLDFDSYFADSLKQLKELVEAGLVSLTDDAVAVTEQGRLLVRNVAMVFDRYLASKIGNKTVFSRTV